MSNSREHKGFYPHFNRSLGIDALGRGKFIGSYQQYDRELKSRGLVRENPDAKYAPKVKPHSVSRETRKLVEAIKSQTQNGKFNPSGTLQSELIKRGAIKKMSEVQKLKEKMPKESGSGGFY